MVWESDYGNTASANAGATSANTDAASANATGTSAGPGTVS